MDRKPRRPGIISQEAAFGCKVSKGKGLSHISKAKRAPELSRFLNGVGKLNVGHEDCRTAKELRESKSFSTASYGEFHEIGPIMWPDILPSWAWSFVPSERLYYNDYAKKYPKQLRFSDFNDRAV